MARKVAAVLLLIIAAQFFSPMPAAATSFGAVDAACALLIERDNGIFLFEQNIFERRPMDALTKVMTLLLAAEAIEAQRIMETDIVEMTDAAWDDVGEGETTQNIAPGDRMSFIDLMYSAYVGNAFEACNMIALRVAGNTGAFVRMMNDKAAELGCTDTNFVNPHGRHDVNQYTTAYDIYLIYAEAMKSDIFMEISSTYRHITAEAGETSPRTLVSSNSLMNPNGSYFYRHCQSGIGTVVGAATFESGYSLVSSAEENGLTLIAVVLGGRDILNPDQSVTLTHFSETNRLYIWGYANFGWRDILKSTTLLAKVPVQHGNGADFINVRPDRSFSMLLESSVPDSAFKLEIIIFSEVDDTPLVAPISAGDVLGEVIVSRDGVVYDTIALIANTDIDISPFQVARRELLAILSTPAVRYVITALVFIVAIYIGLVIRYNVIRVKRLRRIRDAKNELIREKQQQLYAQQLDEFDE